MTPTTPNFWWFLHTTVPGVNGQLCNTTVAKQPSPAWFTGSVVRSLLLHGSNAPVTSPKALERTSLTFEVSGTPLVLKDVCWSLAAGFVQNVVHAGYHS